MQEAASASPDNPELGDALRAPAAPPAGHGHGTSVLALLIWFHHIKSLEKRKRMVEWARELRLAGGCKPGFPGVVVVEGAEDDAREFVARVRSLPWQAMQVGRRTWRSLGDAVLGGRWVCKCGTWVAVSTPLAKGAVRP